jgi:hypothetical protein
MNPCLREHGWIAVTTTEVVEQELIPAAIHFSDKIREAYGNAIEGIFQMGRLLLEAKEMLEHGEFQAMIERELPFGPRAAQMLMKIAQHPVLTNAKHVSLLPPNWGTLHEIARLPPSTVENLIEEGKITPQLMRKQVAGLASKTRSNGQVASGRVRAPKVAERELPQTRLGRWQEALSTADEAQQRIAAEVKSFANACDELQEIQSELEDLPDDARALVKPDVLEEALALSFGDATSLLEDGVKEAGSLVKRCNKIELTSLPKDEELSD